MLLKLALGHSIDEEGRMRMFTVLNQVSAHVSPTNYFCLNGIADCVNADLHD